jgi:hypothetical protein
MDNFSTFIAFRDYIYPSPPLIQLCFLSSCTCFFDPACFWIKPSSIVVLHVFLILQKKRSSSRLLYYLFAVSQQIRNLNLTGIEHATEHFHRFRSQNKVSFGFNFNQFHNQKITPCNRTTLSSGLHYHQVQKWRWTVLDADT